MMPPRASTAPNTHQLPRPRRTLVAAERFLQPPRAALRSYLRVDHQRYPPVPRQPVAHWEQLRTIAHRHAFATVAGADRGQVGVRELDRRERVAVGAEVVHL